MIRPPHLPRVGGNSLKYLFSSCTVITLVAAIATATAADAPTSKLDARTVQRIDDLVAIAMAHQSVPAISLAIARNGAVLYARGYGYRELTQKRPADANTIYNIASVTKQFTAACIMLLQQDGKLSIDDSLARYYPQYRYARQLTLRNLLNQTSGIPDYTELPNLPHYATAMQFFQLVRERPLDFAPGTRYEYSNTNYVLLGAIVEKVSGESYGDFVARHIFDPLAMVNSSARVEPRELPNGATGYTFDGGRIRYQSATPDDIGYGDGTINSTALDLVRWDAALEGGRVVDARSWREMTSPPVALYEPAYGGYGFGLAIGRLYGRRVIWHTGGNPGFAALNATFPSDGLEVVMLANSDNFDGTPLLTRIVELVAHPTPAEIAAEAQPAPNEDMKVRALAQEWLVRLQTGKIDRSRLTGAAARELTPGAARTQAAKAKAIGTPRSFVYRGMEYRARRFDYTYRVTFAGAVVSYDVVLDGSGKIAGLFLERQDPALLGTI